MRPLLPIGLLLFSPMMSGAVLAAVSLPDCIDPIIEQRRDENGAVLNALSLSEGPNGVLLELAPGDWGRPLGPSVTLEIDCAEGTVRELAVPGASEVSDPWYDRPSGRLYFVARVERPDGGSDRDLFFSRALPEGWQPAERLPEPLNSVHDEYAPVARGERLYFASSRRGSGDLYLASLANTGAEPRALPAAINSIHGEWNLWVSPDERTLVFESSGRISNRSIPGDLYLAQRDGQGRWRPAVALRQLNREGSDLNPRLLGDSLVWAQSDADTRRTRLKQAHWPDVIRQVEQAWDGQLAFAGRSSHEIGVIGLADGELQRTIPLDQGPHLLALSPSGRFVAAAAYGVFPRPHTEPVTSNPGWVEGEGGRVLIWDRASDSATRLDSGCGRPHGVAWSGDRAAWFSCEDRRAVVRIEPGNGVAPARTTLVATGHRGAHVLAWDAPRQRLLATHTEAGGLWFGGVSEFLPLGPGSEAIHLLADGLHALVGVGPSGEVVKVDLETRAEVARWNTGCKFPISITADAWQRVWLACLQSREVQRLDTETGEVLQRLELTAGPLHVAAHPVMPLLYASTPRRNEILELPMESLPGVSAASRHFAAGVEPDGLALLSALPHQSDVE